jgi:hypothetical protein
MLNRLKGFKRCPQIAVNLPGRLQLFMKTRELSQARRAEALYTSLRHSAIG